MLQLNRLVLIILRQQSLHAHVHLFGQHGLFASHFIGKPFVLSYCEPSLLAIGGIGFVHAMQFFDMRFGNLVGSMVNDIIHAAEMVHRLQNIINARVFSSNAKCVCLKDITRLFFCQAASFNMVVVLCKVNMRTMIDTSLLSGFLFLA